VSRNIKYRYLQIRRWSEILTFCWGYVWFLILSLYVTYDYKKKKIINKNSAIQIRFENEFVLFLFVTLHAQRFMNVWIGKNNEKITSKKKIVDNVFVCIKRTDISRPFTINLQLNPAKTSATTLEKGTNCTTSWIWCIAIIWFTLHLFW